MESDKVSKISLVTRTTEQIAFMQIEVKDLACENVAANGAILSQQILFSQQTKLY